MCVCVRKYVYSEPDNDTMLKVFWSFTVFQFLMAKLAQTTFFYGKEIYLHNSLPIY